MSIVASLTVEGVRLRAWERDPLLTAFNFGTMDGLLDLRGRIRVIAIFNDASGNGQLVKLISLLERLSIEHALPLDVVELWNDRLALWFKKRGYRVGEDPETNLTASFRLTKVHPAR